MIILEDGERISEAEHTAAIIEGTAKTEHVGVTKVVSVRIPLNLLCSVQALAHKSGKTRNSMICHLLQVGVEDVRAHLSDETLDTINQIELELLTTELVQEAAC